MADKQRLNKLCMCLKILRGVDHFWQIYYLGNACLNKPISSTVNLNFVEYRIVITWKRSLQTSPKIGILKTVWLDEHLPPVFASVRSNQYK